MKSQEAIRVLLDRQERTQRSVANELGISPQSMTSRVDSGRGSMRVDKLCETAQVLGQKVVLVPLDSNVGVEITG